MQALLERRPRTAEKKSEPAPTRTRSLRLDVHPNDRHPEGTLSSWGDLTPFAERSDPMISKGRITIDLGGYVEYEAAGTARVVLRGRSNREDVDAMPSRPSLRTRS